MAEVVYTSLTPNTAEKLAQLASEHYLTRSFTIATAIHLLAAMSKREGGWAPFRAAFISSLNDYLSDQYEKLNHVRNPARLLRAIHNTASSCNLVKVAETDQCRIYCTESGILVNCWYTGSRGYRVGPGAAGFDTEIQWYLTAAALADATGKTTEIADDDILAASM